MWLLKGYVDGSCVTAEGGGWNWWLYHQHFTSKEKLEPGKRAAELGISSTIRYFTAKPGDETENPFTQHAIYFLR